MWHKSQGPLLAREGNRAWSRPRARNPIVRRAGGGSAPPPVQARSMTSTVAIARLPGRWMVLWMLVVVRVAMGYQFQAAASAAPWLIGEFKIDYATVGSLVGFYTLPGILFALPGGYIARRVGEK